MSDPTIVKKLTEQCREFIAGLRITIAQSAGDGEAEQVIERIFATVGIVGAAVIMAMPGSKKERFALALLSMAMRFLSRPHTPRGLTP